MPPTDAALSFSWVESEGRKGRRRNCKHWPKVKERCQIFFEGGVGDEEEAGGLLF